LGGGHSSLSQCEFLSNFFLPFSVEDFPDTDRHGGLRSEPLDFSRRVCMIGPFEDWYGSKVRSIGAKK